MGNDTWPELGGNRLQYANRTWELGSEVSVLDDGDLLGVKATAVDDVRGQRATLYFTIDQPPASLNPGDLGEHFDSFEPAGGTYAIDVRTPGRTYRYDLERMTYE
jgi:hypothetical protein